jgi:PAB-dependent poly(A)-specific ribonuclease subunit 2
MDIQGNYMVTCGYSSRNGQLLHDSLLKVYDIRTMKAISPISCHINPSHLKFLPNGKIFAANATGSIQICNLTKELDEFLTANVNGYLSHLEVSSAGMVAIGDSFGCIQLWSDNGLVNNYSRETAYVDLNPAPLPAMDDNTYFILTLVRSQLLGCRITRVLCFQVLDI